MAQLTIKLPEDFIKKLENASDKSSEAIDSAIEAGCNVMEPIIRSNLQASIGRGTKGKSQSTGELLRALGTSPIKVTGEGVHNAKIGFKEPRNNGESNAMIANILEYGTKDGRQPARPFLATAKKSGRQKCVQAMEEAFDEKMRNLQ